MFPTAKIPNIFLNCTASNITGIDSWPYDDGSLWYANGNFYTWQVTLATIIPQAHSSEYTLPDPYQYSGLNLKVGQWIAGGVPTKALRIKSIVSSSAYSATIVVEDVERFNTFYDLAGAGNGIFGDRDCYIFECGEDGLPIIAPLSFGAFIDPFFTNDLISRFRINNPNFRFRVNQTAHGLVVGNELYLDSVSGLYKLLIAGKQPIGRVIDIADSPDTFLMHPSTRIIEGISPNLPGAPGDILYYSETVPGVITTIVGPRAAYVKINDTTGMRLSQGSGSGGVTVYPNLAARPTSASVGAEAYVTDVGNGEWAMYVYTLSGWVVTSTKDSAATNAVSAELTITSATASPVLISTMSNGRRVTLVTVTVSSAFDGAPTLSIGDSGVSDRLFTNAMVDLSKVESYSAQSDHLYNSGSDTDINVYFVAGGATTGTATITLSYV